MPGWLVVVLADGVDDVAGPGDTVVDPDDGDPRGDVICPGVLVICPGVAGV
jgi:hypothetical protein